MTLDNRPSVESGGEPIKSRRLVSMRLPVGLLEEVDRAVGERGRTEFFVRAARRELVRSARVARAEAFRRASAAR